MSDPIGRPPECLSYDQDLESINLCQIFCCPPTPVINPQEITSSFYSEKKPSLSMNKTTPLFNVEKNKIKPFHSNDIDKQRQRRDTSHDIGSDNAFHAKEDPTFRLFIQGKNFNATLTNQYLSSVTDSYNFSYSVPISKYMPDDYISLIFCSAQPNIRQIEHCYTDNKELACRPSMSLRYEDKPYVRHKENSPGQLLCSQSKSFEIEMVDFQSKALTYRASLQQSQNACKLPSSQLGVEFVEYNFLFFRHCEE